MNNHIKSRIVGAHLDQLQVKTDAVNIKQAMVWGFKKLAVDIFICEKNVSLSTPRSRTETGVSIKRDSVYLFVKKIAPLSPRAAGRRRHARGRRSQRVPAAGENKKGTIIYLIIYQH